MINEMEEFGNPFEEDTKDLLVLDTKDIAPPGAVDAHHRLQKLEPEHLEKFAGESLLERMNLIEDVHRNKLLIFGQPVTEPQVKGRQQTKYLENDVNFFSLLYIARLTLAGNLDEFFRHKLRLLACSTERQWHPNWYEQ